MKRLIITAFVALMCLSTTWAQKNVVWERPLTAYNRAASMLSVSRMEFTDTATVLTFHVRIPNTPQIGFTSATKLQADGREYNIKGVKDYALNEGINMPESGEISLDLIFEPVPADVKILNFNMEGAFSINGIRDRHAKKDGIADTYWRNDKTGDWVLGVGRNHVVYDSKVWSITSQTENKGAYMINGKNGSEAITVNISKEKKGQRTISVGKEKALCSMITEDYLPDYPSKDTTTKLADNGYRMGDSITIVGWYKDMPQAMWKKSGEFSASYEGIFTDDKKMYFAKLDSLGCFTLRMPVENAQMLYCDWGRTNLFFIAEPGETYFIMRDFAEDKTLVMGQNARLQNEWLGHSIIYRSASSRDVEKRGGIMPFLYHCDSLKNDALSKLDAEIKEHPTLSARYEKLYRNLILTKMARDLMQARFNVPNRDLPKEYIDFVTDICWKQIEGPYTALGNGYTTFFRDYYDNLLQSLPKANENLWRYGLLKADKEGRIKLSDADKTFIDEYVAGLDALNRQIAEAPDSLKQKIAYAFNNGRLVTGLNEILDREGVRDIVESELNIYDYERLLAAADSLGWNQTQKDIMLSMNIYKSIDWRRKSLQPHMLAYADAKIQLDAAEQAIHELNDKYEAIGKRTLATDNLKSSDDVKDLSEGEQILRKILEPYKGKIVLLDIWGTWCSPCKAALAKSQEEYEHLKDYPMAYIYLANRSPEESWKNVIKEYNVTGDNVAHYNLPEAQQKAIENYLQVMGFPTYKLFDQQGNLLDVNADPRSIDNLEGLIKKIVE